MVLVRLDRALWSRCKACAYRRRMGVWGWLAAVLGAVCRAEEGMKGKGFRYPAVEETVGSMVAELFGEMPPVVRERKEKKESSTPSL